MRRLLASLERERSPAWLVAAVFAIAFVFALDIPTEIDPWDLAYVWNGYYWFFSDPSVLHEQQLGCYASNLIGASIMHGFGRASPFAFAAFVAAVATPCALALRRWLRPVLSEPLCTASVLVGLATSTWVGLPWCYRSLPFYSGLSALFGLAFLLVLMTATCDRRPALFFWAGALFALLVAIRLNNALLVLLTVVVPFDSVVRRRGPEPGRYLGAAAVFLAGLALGGSILLAVAVSLGQGSLLVEGLRTLLTNRETYGDWSNHFYFQRATVLDLPQLMWVSAVLMGSLALFTLLHWGRPRLLARNGLAIAAVVALVPQIFNSKVIYLRLPVLLWWLFVFLAVAVLARGTGPPAWRVLALGSWLLVLLLPLGAIGSAYHFVSKSFLLVVPMFVGALRLVEGRARPVLWPATQALLIATFAAVAVSPPLARLWENAHHAGTGFVVRETGGIPVRLYSSYPEQLDEAVTQLRQLHVTHPGRLLAWEHLPQLHALTGIPPLAHTGGWIGLVHPPERLVNLLRAHRQEIGLVFQQKQRLFPADPATVAPGYTYSVPFLDLFLPPHARPPADARQVAYDAFVGTLTDFELLVDRPTYRILGRRQGRQP